MDVFLTLLEVTVCCLCSSWNFDFIRPRNCGNVSCSSSSHHDICLHLRCSWTSVCSFDIAKVLRNTFGAGLRDAISPCMRLPGFVQKLCQESVSLPLVNRNQDSLPFDGFHYSNIQHRSDPFQGSSLGFLPYLFCIWKRRETGFEYKLEFISCCRKDYVVVTSRNEFQIVSAIMLIKQFTFPGNQRCFK